MIESEVESMMNDIRNDRLHGANWLSKAALDVLISASKIEYSDSIQLVSKLFDLSKKLVNIRPSMAPIANIAAAFVHEIRKREKMPLPQLRELIKLKASMLSDASDVNMRKAAKKASELLESTGTVITNSYSSTVLEVLTMVPKVKVIVPESRPLLEGVSLAQELSRRKIHVILIVDSAIGIFSEKADATIVGADSVLADGSFVNKIGTRLLALASMDSGIPFYTVCDTLKFDARSHMGWSPVLEEKDPSEVASRMQGVEICNPYFEITPRRLVTSLMTEIGAMDEEMIRLKMDEMSSYLRPLLK